MSTTTCVSLLKVSLPIAQIWPNLINQSQVITGPSCPSGNWCQDLTISAWGVRIPINQLANGDYQYYSDPCPAQLECDVLSEPVVWQDTKIQPPHPDCDQLQPNPQCCPPSQLKWQRIVWNGEKVIVLNWHSWQDDWYWLDWFTFSHINPIDWGEQWRNWYDWWVTWTDLNLDDIQLDGRVPGRIWLRGQVRQLAWRESDLMNVTRLVWRTVCGETYSDPPAEIKTEDLEVILSPDSLICDWDWQHPCQPRDCCPPDIVRVNRVKLGTIDGWWWQIMDDKDFNYQWQVTIRPDCEVQEDMLTWAREHEWQVIESQPEYWSVYVNGSNTKGWLVPANWQSSWLSLQIFRVCPGQQLSSQSLMVSDMEIQSLVEENCPVEFYGPCNVVDCCPPTPITLEAILYDGKKWLVWQLPTSYQNQTVWAEVLTQPNAPDSWWDLVNWTPRSTDHRWFVVNDIIWQHPAIWLTDFPGWQFQFYTRCLNGGLSEPSVMINGLASQIPAVGCPDPALFITPCDIKTGQELIDCIPVIKPKPFFDLKVSRHQHNEIIIEFDHVGEQSRARGWQPSPLPDKDDLGLWLKLSASEITSLNEGFILVGQLPRVWIQDFTERGWSERVIPSWTGVELWFRAPNITLNGGRVVLELPSELQLADNNQNQVSELNSIDSNLTEEAAFHQICPIEKDLTINLTHDLTGGLLKITGKDLVPGSYEVYEYQLARPSKLTQSETEFTGQFNYNYPNLRPTWIALNFNQESYKLRLPNITEKVITWQWPAQNAPPGWLVDENSELVFDPGCYTGPSSVQLKLAGRFNQYIDIIWTDNRALEEGVVYSVVLANSQGDILDVMDWRLATSYRWAIANQISGEDSFYLRLLWRYQALTQSSSFKQEFWLPRINSWYDQAVVYPLIPVCLANSNQNCCDVPTVWQIRIVNNPRQLQLRWTSSNIQEYELTMVDSQGFIILDREPVVEGLYVLDLTQGPGRRWFNHNNALRLSLNTICQGGIEARPLVWEIPADWRGEEITLSGNEGECFVGIDVDRFLLDWPEPTPALCCGTPDEIWVDYLASGKLLVTWSGRTGYNYTIELVSELGAVFNRSVDVIGSLEAEFDLRGSTGGWLVNPDHDSLKLTIWVLCLNGTSSVSLILPLLEDIKKPIQYNLNSPCQGLLDPAPSLERETVVNGDNCCPGLRTLEVMHQDDYLVLSWSRPLWGRVNYNWQVTTTDGRIWLTTEPQSESYLLLPWSELENQTFEFTLDATCSGLGSANNKIIIPGIQQDNLTLKFGLYCGQEPVPPLEWDAAWLEEIPVYEERNL